LPSFTFSHSNESRPRSEGGASLGEEGDDDEDSLRDPRLPVEDGFTGVGMIG
jgi:hypothetical protein